MRRLFSGLAGLTVLWALGLIFFVANLPDALPSSGPPRLSDADGALNETPSPLSNVDGIAVYTGGGGARITAAMTIFADGAGQRLLISGVNPNTSRARLSELWGGAPDRFDCCVDLGHDALSTEGNANELSSWARTHNYKKIILVTSEYHMPRAVAMTRARMPDAELTPYPVASGYLTAHGWPASLDAHKHIAGEYTKYLFAKAKAYAGALGR